MDDDDVEHTHDRNIGEANGLPRESQKDSLEKMLLVRNKKLGNEMAGSESRIRVSSSS